MNHLNQCNFRNSYVQVLQYFVQFIHFALQVLSGSDFPDDTRGDEAALTQLVASSYASNQPHTRAPFSNMLPDFFVIGPHFAWKGHGGVVAAGFFDEAWHIAQQSSYFQCEAQG